MIAAVLDGSDIDIFGSDDDELDKGQHPEYKPFSSEEESDSPIGNIILCKEERCPKEKTNFKA